MKAPGDQEFYKVDLFGHAVTAIFSPCGQYRYMLHKHWDVWKPSVLFIGLNPSTATHEKPDPTIIKVTKIAKANNFGSFYMMNLFAYISAYPEALLTIKDPQNNNHYYLDRVKNRVGKVVFCWGAFKEARQRAEIVKLIFPIAHTLHVNKDGSPKHPLYCKDNTPLIPFNGQAKN